MQEINEADEEAARDVMQQIYEDAAKPEGVDFAFPPRTQPVATSSSHIARKGPIMRFGMNRADHRKNLRAMAKERKRRERVRAEHDARAVGTFKPLPGFDDE